MNISKEAYPSKSDDPLEGNLMVKIRNANSEVNSVGAIRIKIPFTHIRLWQQAHLIL